ncbi:hypothetical protein ACFWY9_19645 [Amycolatopsis sp. NPDC059027]|uniref:hypothetical protein n=1 Tax=Amycolatopsis sp. NPDC059027 TaxID=3346709 RepID=UPI0036716D9A
MNQLVTQPPAMLAGRVLAYVDEAHCSAAVTATGSHPASGLVVAKPSGIGLTRQLRSAGYGAPIVVDVRSWADRFASVDAPTDLADDSGLLPAITLDEWADPVLRAGATAVLTPSRFVRAGDWPALKAVLNAGEEASLPTIVTLVATDAAMLDPQYFATFVQLTSARRQPVGFVFASNQPPFNRRGRAAALRALTKAVPGSMLLGVDALVGLDAPVHGAHMSAIGITGGQRRPRRPGDNGGGGNARDWVPGLFLRDLWEQRSPSTYADWYANSRSPVCAACGGRALDSFGNSDDEKHAVLSHNVHAWLGVLTEMRQVADTERAGWLAEQRLGGFEAHAMLRPAGVRMEADLVLRQLVELDDPGRRRTTPDGAWL